MSPNQSKYQKRFGGAFLSLFILSLCLVPGFVRTPIGINFFDEPYQILNGMFPENAPYSPLSAYLTKWCGELFNWRWLYFRYLALGLNALSIILAGGYLFYKSGKYWYSLILTAIALLVGSIIPHTFNIYGWDDWTQFNLILIVITFFNYISRPKLWKVVLLAALSAILTFLRIPNISILLIVCGLIWVLFKKTPNFSRQRNIFFYLGSGAVFLFLGVLAMYGSIGNYVASFIENPIDQHGIIHLAYGFVVGLVIAGAYCCLYKTLYDLLEMPVINSHKWLSKLALLIIFGFVFIFTDITEKVYYIWSLSALLAIIIFGAIVFYFRNREGFYSLQSLKLTSALLLGCIPFVGSNVGAVKFIIFPMIPILGLFLQPYLNRNLKTLALCVFAAVYSFVGFKLSRQSFADEGYFTISYRMNGGKMDGLYTTPERGSSISKTFNAFSKYSNETKKTIILRANMNYLMEYLFNARNNYLGSRFEYPNIHFSQEYIDWAENEIINSDKPVVVLWQKFETFEPSDIPDLPMLVMLQKHLNLAEDIDGYLIYISPECTVN